MPLIKGLSNVIGGLSKSNLPVKFDVLISSAKPTRREVADAYFAHFGFKRTDAAFIKQHSGGTDLLAHFERNFQLKAGSIKTSNGQTSITLEADAKTYATMRRLARLHHAAPPSATSLPTNAREAMQVKQGFDTSALLKARLNQQLDRQIANQQPVAQPKPLPPPPPPPSAVENVPASADMEGVAAFVEGVVAGDFSDNNSLSATAGKILGGLNPIADFRDIGAGIKHVAEGKDGAAFELGTAMLGTIPVVGDAGKVLARGGRKVVTEVVEASAERAAKESVSAIGGKLWQVSTGGLRNEVPLTAAQKSEVLSYARQLGMPDKAIIFSDNMNTSYKMVFGVDRLYIGTDVLPALKQDLPANSRVTLKSAVAHEVVGHRAAELAGRTQSVNVLEEAQASIRAARFAPDLTSTERVTLLRDAIERLHKQGIKSRDIKSQLWIDSQ